MAFSTDQLAEVHGALAQSQGAAQTVNQLDRPGLGTPRAVASPPPPPPPPRPPDVRDRENHHDGDGDDGRLLCPEDRRRAPRLREQCNAIAFEWDGTRAGAAFAVMVENISTTGIGIIHTERLQLGRQYLLEIPRLRCAPLVVRFTVVHCAARRGGGLFDVWVTPMEVLSITAAHSQHRPCDDADTLQPRSRLHVVMQWLGRLMRGAFSASAARRH